MEGIKAVIFDFDETLTDPLPGIKSAHGAVVDRLHGHLVEKGKDVGKEKIMSALHKIEREYSLARNYNRDEWWEKLLVGLGDEPPSPDFSREVTGLYWRKIAEDNLPYPDAEPLLEHLKKKGYRLGLVTDTDGTPGIKWGRLKDVPLMRFFDAVVIAGEDTPRSKPDAGPFLLAAGKLGVKPGECLMVGDKPFTDVRGGNAAGMRTVHLKRREWGVEEPADFTVTSLEELMGLL